jgi:hypothetical protein
MMRRFRTLQVPTGVHPLVRLIFTEMNEQRIGTRDLAERSGVSAFTVEQWKFRRSPKLDCLEATLNALGIELTTRRMVDHEG